MSNSKKAGAALLILIGAAMVIHAFSPAGTPEEFRLREITPEEHAEADEFIETLSGYARKGTRAPERPRAPGTPCGNSVRRKAG